MARNGPTKRTPERRKRILDVLRAGGTRQAAYGSGGIADTTFARWMADDAEFAEDVKIAESEAEARATAIVSKAMGETWQAAAWWLERRRSGDYAKRTNIGIGQDPDAAPLKIEVTYVEDQSHSPEAAPRPAED